MPEILQQFYRKRQERLNKNDGELLKKLICIDGKTMRSNKRGDEKASHIVSAWSKEAGFCLGQKAVEKKSNEVTAIPELFDRIRAIPHNTARIADERICALMTALFCRNTLCISRKSDYIRTQIIRQMLPQCCAVLP